MVMDLRPVPGLKIRTCTGYIFVGASPRRGARVYANKNGQSWLTGLIHEMFKQWWELWDTRNHDRHGKDAQTQAQAANRQAIHELELIYNKCNDLVLPQHIWTLQTPFRTRSQ